MNKYKNGKIYEITSNNTDLVYVGSCITTLNVRLTLHNSRRKCSSKYILECGDYNINLIEYFSCNNKRELESREQYWIDKYRKDGKNLVNERDAYTSKKKRLNQYKQFRTTHRKKIIESRKQYHEKNREKNKDYCREYYEKNREKQKERAREFRFMNKKEYVNACYEFLEMLKHY